MDTQKTNKLKKVQQVFFQNNIKQRLKLSHHLSLSNYLLLPRAGSMSDTLTAELF
jgi:hypothetical protein